MFVSADLTTQYLSFGQVITSQDGGLSYAPCAKLYFYDNFKYFMMWNTIII